MFKLVTNCPVAFDSHDHTHPLGTKQDNHTSVELIQELEEHKMMFTLMDLGCSGGQFIIDAADRHHDAIGLEGSDYSIVHARANWPKYNEEHLFTCDIGRPFLVLWDFNDKVVQFDYITAWESMEHIRPEYLDIMLTNVYNHLADDGLFFGSLGLQDVSHHPSCHTPEEWKQILSKLFVVEDYPFKNSVRPGAPETTFPFAARKRKWVQ